MNRDVVVLSTDQFDKLVELLTPGYELAKAYMAESARRDAQYAATGMAESIAPTSDDFFLSKILDTHAPLSSNVLLEKNDRIATLAWIDSPDVKETFTRLKEKLRSAFSNQLHDLIDETQSQPGKPPRDILAFRDPAIHTDRLVFARVRQRLYELHVTPGKEAAVDRLVDALTD